MSNQIEQLIKDCLVEKLALVFIIILGSYAKGCQHSESDIDIAYLTEQSALSDYERFMLAQHLAAKLDRNVDLVDLATVSTVFQTQIITSGKVVYCNNELLRTTFEMKTLKMYAKLNEERQIVLDKIKESGAVYDI